MENLTFLQELIARWKAKSPKFFKTITDIGVLLAFITGLPLLLDQLGIAQFLPDAVSGTLVKVVNVAAIVAAILGKLTVATPGATNRVLTKVNDGVRPDRASQSE